MRLLDRLLGRDRLHCWCCGLEFDRAKIIENVGYCDFCKEGKCRLRTPGSFPFGHIDYIYGHGRHVL